MQNSCTHDAFWVNSKTGWEHWPAELLDSADVNDPVVEVVHKLWHVFFQEPLVCMHGVT